MENLPTVCSQVNESFLGSVVWVRELGKGTFGTVQLVRDHSRSYAIKYINAFEGLPASALLDIDSLVRLKGAEGIIRLEGVCYQGQRVALVLEVMDSNLRDYIVSTPIEVRLRQVPFLLKRFSYVLALMESLNIAHFDIKPQNVLVRKMPQGFPDFKLSDFGLARATLPNKIPESDLFTVWYRPPELLAKRDRRTFRIYATDVWAAAATIVEFILGAPIFQGRTETEVLERILRTSTYRGQQFVRDNQTGAIQGRVEVSTLLQALPEVYRSQIDPAIVEVLSMMLSLNPNHRPPGTLILQAFKQAVSPNYLLTFFPSEGHRRIEQQVIEVIIKTANSLGLSKGTTLIAIEIFTRYLTQGLVDKELMASGLSSLMLAGRYNEDKHLSVAKILYSYSGHVYTFAQLAIRKEDLLRIERYILSRIDFQIYNINLTPVIQRAILRNIDLSRVNPNIFAEPLNLWMI